MSKVITSNLDLWARVPLSKSGGRRGGNSKPEAYGVKKLRELILMLAVRGKLVEQDSNDEPASELLKRIASEKARLVKAGEIKKSKSKQVGRFNTLCELPKSWEWATLSDLFLYDAGVKRQPNRKILSRSYGFWNSKTLRRTLDDCLFGSPHLSGNQKASSQSFVLAIFSTEN